MNLVTATPREIDTALAEIYGRYYGVRKQVANYDKWITGVKKSLDPTNRNHRTHDVTRNQELLEKYTVKRGELLAQGEAIMEECTPYEKEYSNRGGWSRFFLVTSSNGHIHKNMNCSTCNYATEYGWLPEVSGKTEAEAVAAHGALLCTVCYPTAPVEWTMGKAVPANQCAGSGTWDYPRETARLGYAAGNYGVCAHCGERVTVTSTRKMRKHKR